MFKIITAFLIKINAAHDSWLVNGPYVEYKHPTHH